MNLPSLPLASENMNDGSSGLIGLNGTQPGCWYGAAISGVLISFISGSADDDVIKVKVADSNKAPQIARILASVLLYTLIYSLHYSLH